MAMMNIIWLDYYPITMCSNANMVYIYWSKITVFFLLSSWTIFSLCIHFQENRKSTPKSPHIFSGLRKILSMNSMTGIWSIIIKWISSMCMNYIRIIRICQKWTIEAKGLVLRKRWKREQKCTQSGLHSKYSVASDFSSLS